MEAIGGVVGLLASLYLWWRGGRHTAVGLVKKRWSPWVAWPAGTAAGFLLGLGVLSTVMAITSPDVSLDVLIFGSILVAAYLGVWLWTRKASRPSTGVALDTASPHETPPSPSASEVDGTGRAPSPLIDISPKRKLTPASAERSEAEEAEGLVVPPGAVLSFDYSDADGVLTRRSVRSAAFATDAGREYIKAYCLDRGAVRTFRCDRIVGPVELQTTGERVTVRRLLAQLPGSKRESAHRDEVRPESKNRERKTAVVFVGFQQDRRWRLEDEATSAGWQVRSTISKTVTYVVAGSMTGEKQLERAAELGVPVITEEQFERRLT